MPSLLKLLVFILNAFAFNFVLRNKIPVEAGVVIVSFVPNVEELGNREGCLIF